MITEVTFSDIPILRSSYVHMKDENVVIQKINKIIQDGSEKLQIVTDFDLTITKQHVDGRKSLASYGVLYKSKRITEELRKNARSLYDKYRPIEINTKISKTHRIQAMVEWNKKSQEMLSGVQLDRGDIKEVVNNYGPTLRDRTKELFLELEKANVPVLVFSAGLGDVVQAILIQNEILSPNVKIISNFLQFKENTIEGFKNGNKIHVFNKNEHAIEDKYLRVLQGRKNVILMGDSTGDAQMADGVSGNETILKIGFYYEDVDNNLPIYKEQFDIVLKDDQTMNVILSILNLRNFMKID